MKPRVIAIDGPAGAGKSTVARELARRLGFRFLDTGAFYRAATLKALRAGLDLADENAVGALTEKSAIELRVVDGASRVFLDGEDVSAAVRGTDVSKAVPIVAAHARVRKAMVPRQRDFAALGPIVAEGRDMATVVFPDAGWKFYLDAAPGVRAARRAAERGDADVAKIEAEITTRDHSDSTRAAAPLRRADEATLVDTSTLSIDEVVAVLERQVRAAPK